MERLFDFIDPDSSLDYELLQDEHEIELYERKNIFFWTVLKHSIQCSTARAIFNQYKADDCEPDSRACFLAIDARMTTGLSQIYSVSHTLRALHRLNLKTFNGTRTGFLTTWFDKLQEYNCTADAEDFMSLVISRSTLNDAIESDPELL